jgi:translation initiation factor IF-2
MSDDVQQTQIIELPQTITVRELALTIDSSPIEVIKNLMANGVMANINQQIDYDTAAIVATEMGFDVKLKSAEELTEEDRGEIPLWRRMIAKEEVDNLVKRPPVVTILGHVDHGKTTLLDAIRDTDVAGGEAGGITQHIGAYQITHDNQVITFLDTPGHAAFTAMRSRGAQGADIVVLVVAADDGVMPQTKEATAHAKAANVPIVVALNKIDRPNADIERTKQQLAEIELIPDEWEGDTIIVPISAKMQEGLEDLLEAILLVADNIDILANPSGQVLGTVIEAERDKAKGVLTTLLVQNGELNVGDTLIAGNTYGRVRAMFDYRGNKIESAKPSTPVSVMGLNDVPQAGDLFQLVDTDREAKSIVQQRLDASKLKVNDTRSAVTLEQFFDQVQAGELQELRLIIKADVQGSLEPVLSSLNDMKVGDIKVNILHAETGGIGENDVMLAVASKAIVIGFNVQPDNAARRLAEDEGVSIRLYEIIYRLTEDIEKALQGMLEPEYTEKVIGRAEVRDIFKISKVGFIAGCYVLNGEIRRNAKMHIIRNDEVIFDGEMQSLKHHQDDVREIRSGFECGIAVKDFQDYQEGDILESYVLEQVTY